MWVFSLAALLLTASGLSLLLARGAASPRHALLWDIPRVAGTYTTICGSLAGFTVASAIFIANLTLARQSPEFDNLIGMFLLAFIIFVSTALLYGTTPSNPSETDADFLAAQRLAYMLANISFYIGISVSWLALPLLLLAIELPHIADVFIWILLFATVSGSARIAQFLHQQTSLNSRACIAVPFVALLVGAFYWYGLGEPVAVFRPGADAPIKLALVCFALAALAFSLQSVLPTMRAHPHLRRFLYDPGERILLVYLQCVSVAVTLLWFSVSTTTI